MSELLDEMMDCAKNHLMQYGDRDSHDHNMALVKQAREEIAVLEATNAKLLVRVKEADAAAVHNAGLYSKAFQEVERLRGAIYAALRGKETP